jgi:hypothetical protein
LIAVPALIYATGFLVVFTAEERLGLIDTAGEFFKIKYMHVGVLCATFIALFAGLAYAQRELANKRVIQKSKPTTNVEEQTQSNSEVEEQTPSNSPTPPPLRSRHLFLLIAPVMAGLYVQLTIASPGSFRGWPAYCLLAYSLITVFGGMILHHFNLIKKDCTPTAIWFWFVGALGIAFLVVELLIVEWNRWVDPGWSVIGVLMLILFAALIGRILHVSVDRARTETMASSRTVWWFIGASFVGFFYYITAYGFAYVLYPYISISKGGGDYTDAPDTYIYFAEIAEDAVPANTLDGRRRTVPLVILLETADTIYAAEDMDSRRGRWGKSADDVPSRIYQFNRSLVSVIEVVTVRRRSSVAPSTEHDATDR